MSTWLNILIPVLNNALRTAKLAPSRTLDELRTRIGAIEDGETVASPFFHDGTERPVPRPKDPGEQKDY